MDDPDNSTVEDCASEVKEGTPSKKEYSKEELWKFVRKQKKQALLLEEQNKSLKEQLANAAGAQGSAKQGNHAGKRWPGARGGAEARLRI